jgi:hypothetical protein
MNHEKIDLVLFLMYYLDVPAKKVTFDYVRQFLFKLDVRMNNEEIAETMKIYKEARNEDI